MEPPIVKCSNCGKVRPARITVIINGQPQHFCEACHEVNVQKFLKQLADGDPKANALWTDLNILVNKNTKRTDD